MSFIITDASFTNEDESFKNKDASFKNVGGRFIKMKKSCNFVVSNSFIIGVILNYYGFVNLIPLICLYCGEVAPNIAFTYFLTSEATSTKPVSSE